MTPTSAPEPGGFPDGASKTDRQDECMTKLIATAALALLATFASVAPAAAAPSKGPDRVPSAKVTEEPGRLFDIEYWGNKAAPHRDAKIVVQSGNGEI